MDDYVSEVCTVVIVTARQTHGVQHGQHGKSTVDHVVMHGRARSCHGKSFVPSTLWDEYLPHCKRWDEVHVFASLLYPFLPIYINPWAKLASI